MAVDDAEDEFIELPTFEYTEDWVNIGRTWGETLNNHGKEGWQLKLVLIDELDEQGTKHPGRRRLIFERELVDAEDT